MKMYRNYHHEENEEEEEDVHVISDQDSTNEKPGIENIINETSKKFKNESIFIKILLSEHYKDFRAQFFQKIKRTDKSIFQGIKKEIRNYLNPYRIFLEKDIEISKDVKELYELLKGYYKEKNFNNTFFLNYFRDLEEAHKKKSKIINMLPKDEIETLNDIQRKVIIIKNLKHYLNTTICDRMQTNFEQKKELFENNYFLMMYKYLVIDEDNFSNMKEEKIFEYLNNKKTSNKLRRPLNDFNVYNYIPILCKGYCQKEANMFIDKFNKSIIEHVNESDCQRCKKLKEDMPNINSQIKSLYLKTCIFSHNINEIMFHPLMFFSLEIYLPFYQKQFNKTFDENIKKIVQEYEIPTKFKNLKRLEIYIIYNAADVGMKKIYNLLTQYAKKNGLYGNCCYLNENKTKPCQILFQPNNNDYYVHMKKCPYYHNKLEKRRIIKNCENEICKCVIEDGKWINREEKINCKNSDFCNKYHTRNEVFFDEKNYRKIYPCTEPHYCEKGNLCPKKHAIDIKIEEIYLPIKNKNELEKNLKELINKDAKIKRKIDKFHNAKCKSCLNYIDGNQGRNMYIFNICNHVICSKCYDYFNSCPLCGLNNSDKNNKNENVTNIILDYIKIKKKKKVEKENEREENKKEEAEEENESTENEISDKNDQDITDSKNHDYNDDYDENNLECDITINATYPVEKSNISAGSDSEEKEEEDKQVHSNKGKKRGKGTVINNESRIDNHNTNYSNNENNFNRRYKGRGRGRGRGGYYREGGRGRGQYKYNSRDNSYYNSSNNNFIYYKDEESSYQNQSSRISKGKGHKRGSTNAGKKSFFDSEKPQDDSKDNSMSSKSNSDTENNRNYENEFSMIKRNNKRKGVPRGGKGKLRGSRFGNEKNKGNNIEEKSGESNDSNEFKNSMEKDN